MKVVRDTFFSLAATLLKELISFITRKFCNHMPSNKEMFRKYSWDFKVKHSLLKLFNLKALLSSEYMVEIVDFIQQVRITHVTG